MAMKKQGIPLSSLPWHNKATRYTTPAALFMCLLILITNGFEVFTRGGWSTSGFISAYLDIPLVLTAFLLWKFIKKTRFIKLSEIPLKEALDDIDRNPEPLDPASKGWMKYIGVLWD